MSLRRPALVVVLLPCALLAAACGASGPASAPADVAGAVDVVAAAADARPDAAPPAAAPCRDPGTPGATAGCLAPTRPLDYYAEQSSKYFDTLDVAAAPDSVPAYAEWVARWEWPPWLLLTGYGRQDMIDTALFLKQYDPSTVPQRDCRGFDTQPFGRCYVVFEYAGGPCPIYEEFTFNDAGEMTFIEAWSDLPGLLPHTDPADRWAELPGTVDRLATRLPGLGSAAGRVALDSAWMAAAAAGDPDVAEFATRAADWWAFWVEALQAAPEGFFAQGCGW